MQMDLFSNAKLTHGLICFSLAGQYSVLGQGALAPVWPHCLLTLPTILRIQQSNHRSDSLSANDVHHNSVDTIYSNWSLINSHPPEANKTA